MDHIGLFHAVAALTDSTLATEESACNAFVAARWPKGVIRCPRCKAACTRKLAHLRCNGPKPHRLTIFYATPLGTKLRPNVRATLLALRAIAFNKRSISARELARETGANHVTLWRHLHSIRAVLPRLDQLRVSSIDRQTFRTWINGTFHGITTVWHHRYWQERWARRFLGENMLWTELARFVVGASPVTLDAARRRGTPDEPHRRHRAVVDETRGAS